MKHSWAPLDCCDKISERCSKRLSRCYVKNAGLLTEIEMNLKHFRGTVIFVFVGLSRLVCREMWR